MYAINTSKFSSPEKRFRDFCAVFNQKYSAIFPHAYAKKNSAEAVWKMVYTINREVFPGPPMVHYFGELMQKRYAIILNHSVVFIVLLLWRISFKYLVRFGPFMLQLLVQMNTTCIIQEPKIILMKKSAFIFIEHFSIETFVCHLFWYIFSFLFPRRFTVCDVMKSLFLSECVCCLPSDINISKCVLFIKISPAVCVKFVRAPIYWFQQIDWQFQIE